MWSKDWCRGFCRTCGTSCARYCEDFCKLQAEFQEIGELNRMMTEDQIALIRRAEGAEAECDRLQAEVMEQCRLNGIGSEREARLMAQVKELEAKNNFLRKNYQDANMDKRHYKDEALRLRAALEYYANVNIWLTSDGRPPTLGWTEAGDDLGKRARETLTKGGVE